MRFQTLVSVILAASAPAFGTIKEFTASGSNWNVPSNWSPAGIPTASDRVVIPAGVQCIIPENYQAVADTINVKATTVDGELYIQPGASLTLDNDSPHISDPDDSIVDGFIWLNSAGGATATLQFITASHSVSGGGRIEGFDHTTCKIKVANPITLTNNLASLGEGIRGGITFEASNTSTQAPGTLKNNGRIHAEVYDSGGGPSPRSIVLSASMLEPIPEPRNR